MEQQNSYTISTKNKKIGIFWLIAPTFGLIVVLTIYSLVTYIFSVKGMGDQSIVLQLTNIALGFFGIIFVVLILVGIPIGVVYLNKREYLNMQYDERSGKGRGSEVPSEIGGWNWGAAFLTFIWGACNRVWLSFLSFIPVLNWFWWIVLGLKGNKWAWQNNRWESIEKFKQSQRKWNIAGLIIFFMDLVGFILILLNMNK